MVAVQVVNGRLVYGKENYGVRNANLTVSRGTIYGLLGPSGCGKTTLLSAVVGLKRLQAGQVTVLGRTPHSKGSHVPGPCIGYMPQELSLVTELTVEETLRFYGLLHGMETSSLPDRIRFLMQMLELPSNRLTANMSGGQKRRLSLAVAIVHDPSVLILDEPTVGVDPILRTVIWQHLLQLANGQGKAVLITTHYIEEASAAHKVGFMRDGCILAEETPQEALKKYQANSLENVFLKLCNKADLVKEVLTEKMTVSSAVVHSSQTSKKTPNFAYINETQVGKASQSSQHSEKNSETSESANSDGLGIRNPTFVKDKDDSETSESANSNGLGIRNPTFIKDKEDSETTESKNSDGLGVRNPTFVKDKEDSETSKSANSDGLGIRNPTFIKDKEDSETSESTNSDGLGTRNPTFIKDKEDCETSESANSDDLGIRNPTFVKDKEDSETSESANSNGLGIRNPTFVKYKGDSETSESANSDDLGIKNPTFIKDKEDNETSESANSDDLGIRNPTLVKDKENSETSESANSDGLGIRNPTFVKDKDNNGILESPNSDCLRTRNPTFVKDRETSESTNSDDRCIKNPTFAKDKENSETTKSANSDDLPIKIPTFVKDTEDSETSESANPDSLSIMNPTFAKDEEDCETSKSLNSEGLGIRKPTFVKDKDDSGAPETPKSDGLGIRNIIFVKDEEDCESISVQELVQNPSNLTYQKQKPETEFSKKSDVRPEIRISTWRSYQRKIFALTWKNLIVTRRNLVLLVIAFLLPVVNILMAKLLLFKAPFGIPVALVNSDSPSTVSQLLTKSLDQKTLDIRVVDSVQNATRLLHDLEVKAIVHILQGFSMSTVRRAQKGMMTDNSTIDKTLIRLYLGNTNLEVERTIYNSLMESYGKFGQGWLELLGVDPETSSLPLTFKDPVFGTKETDLSTYVTLNMLPDSLFIMGLAFTILVFMSDMASGTTEREYICGVKNIQIMVSHFLIHSGVTTVQVTFLAVFLTSIQYEVKGSYPLFLWLLYQSSYLGMAIGILFVSFNCKVGSALLAVTTIYWTNGSISGVMWPCEGMQPFVRTLSRLDPCTWIYQAVRDVVAKGLPFSNPLVWEPVLVASGSTLALLLVAVLFLERDKARFLPDMCRTRTTSVPKPRFLRRDHKE